MVHRISSLAAHGQVVDCLNLSASVWRPHGANPLWARKNRVLASFSAHFFSSVQAELAGPLDGLSTVGNMQLAVDALYLTLHRLL
jgi:hypothetical protein